MKFSFLNNPKVKEYLKSSAVGLVATLLDFMITALILYAEGFHDYGSFFNVIAHSGMHDSPVSIYLTANLAGMLTGIVINYIMSVFFVYQYGNIGKSKKGFIKFCIFSFIGAGLSTVLSYIGYSLLNMNIWLTKLIVTVIVFVYNFFTRKYFIFNIKLIMDDENTIHL